MLTRRLPATLRVMSLTARQDERATAGSSCGTASMRVCSGSTMVSEWGRALRSAWFWREHAPTHSATVTAKARTTTRMRPASERALHHFNVEAFDYVALLDVLERAKAHAAFLAGDDFVHFILEALQRGQHTHFLDDDVVAQDTHFGALAHNAFGYTAAGDLADLGDVKHLQHFGVAEEGFAIDRREHARHHAFDVVNQIVDDRVVTDFHAFALGQIARFLRSADVEADDRRARRF